MPPVCAGLPVSTCVVPPAFGRESSESVLPPQPTIVTVSATGYQSFAIRDGKNHMP